VEVLLEKTLQNVHQVGLRFRVEDSPTKISSKLDSRTEGASSSEIALLFSDEEMCLSYSRPLARIDGILFHVSRAISA
jgi:hypothetical protein